MPLTVVPTPVGNLEDITIRSIKILRSADLIACEDTRKTATLLKRYAISTKMVSYHSFNEKARTPMILSRLKAGENIALVSDAGTPGISDPGSIIINEAVSLGIRVEVLPGPTALVPAVVVSGLPVEGFLFAGFLNDKHGQRIKQIKKYVLPGMSTVFYVSPHKLIRHMEDILEEAGDLDSSLTREISKIHEETIRGKLSEILDYARKNEVRGELTLVVYREEIQQDDKEWQDDVLILIKEGKTDREILNSILKKYRVRKNAVKEFILNSKQL